VIKRGLVRGKGTRSLIDIGALGHKNKIQRKSIIIGDVPVFSIVLLSRLDDANSALYMIGGGIM